jgi:uncharacterized protein YbjT (DUF2867 family)
MRGSSNGLTLVLGGNGKTGKRVAHRLTARGLPVRMGSRTGTPPFEWSDPGTWAPAVRDVRSVYVTYFPDLALPGAADAVGSFAELAVRSGVRRLVLLSGRGEEGALLGERAVQAAGVDWTILRSTWFNQNFSEGAFVDQVRSGEVALPAGAVKEPFVDAEDIADVAVAALTEDRHAGQVYELTGPRLLTFDEAVAEIAAASRREILSARSREYASLLVRWQLPADFVSLVTYLFREVLDGPQRPPGRWGPAGPGPGSPGASPSTRGRPLRPESGIMDLHCWSGHADG